MLTIAKLLVRLLLAALVGAGVALVFQSVMPRPVATMIGIGFALIELIGGLASGERGAGVGIRMMLRLGEVVLAWPGTAWLLLWAGFDHDGVRIGLAAAVAAAVGMGAARHGYGRDSARLIAVVVAVAIPAYVAIAAVLSGDPRSMIAACVAAAVGPVTARVAHVWPDAHGSRFATAAVLAVVAGVAVYAGAMPPR